MTIESGFAMKPCTVETFNERLRMVRVVHRHHLQQRFIDRDGRRLGTVYLVGTDPVAFYGSDGQYYVRNH
jgi:hypothetical protein